MKLLMKKEWKLVVTPVPLLFLLLSALVLVPSYPYYVTFFYNALGIFLMLQAARENRDVYYMALLPVTKRDVVRARFSTVVTLQLLQIAAVVDQVKGTNLVQSLMAEEGLKRTPNDLIHIGCPVPFDTEIFLEQLKHLEYVAYRNTEHIRDDVKEMVSTYHPQ